jgi:hypothetical protein
MQIKYNAGALKGLLKTVFPFALLAPVAAFAQTTYLQQDAKENVLLERLEIKAKTDSALNFSKDKPYSRKAVIPVIEKYYKGNTDSSQTNNVVLSAVDRYNAESALMNSDEWTSLRFNSKHPLGKNFYQNPAHLYEVNNPDLYLAIDPVLQLQLGKEKSVDDMLFLNTRGIMIRGRLANKIGFFTYLTDNQERDPLYVRQWENQFKSVPGEGYYKEFKTTGYDYFDARGYFTFNVTKYIDVSFGYDKNFIGNGYRSLFLSDFSNNMLFLKLNTRIWKFNYQNLFMELNATEPRGPDRLLAKKYATMHHLDLGVTKWLNLGLFEGIIFGRKDHFEFGYINPIIFYRSIEQQNGSADNAVVGFDAKANVAHKFQFYGQLLIDEFVLSELKADRGWWGNKYGIQVGAKYIDAFHISNLDLQVELNRVRPFTYSHEDSVSNYTHYNQPLAHPLGANFQELIGLLRYQPAPKWLIQGKLIYYYQGKDSVNGSSFGSNIFLPYGPPYRTKDYGFNIGSGVKDKTTLASMLLSYELKQNFFIEGTATYRNVDMYGNSGNTFIFMAGIRWNMNRRTFDF